MPGMCFSLPPSCQSIPSHTGMANRFVLVPTCLVGAPGSLHWPGFWSHIWVRRKHWCDWLVMPVMSWKSGEREMCVILHSCRCLSLGGPHFRSLRELRGAKRPNDLQDLRGGHLEDLDALAVWPLTIALFLLYLGFPVLTMIKLVAELGLNPSSPDSHLIPQWLEVEPLHGNLAWGGYSWKHALLMPWTHRPPDYPISSHCGLPRTC